MQGEERPKATCHDEACWKESLRTTIGPAQIILCCRMRVISFDATACLTYDGLWLHDFAEVIMIAVKAPLSLLKSLGILSVAAIGLLTACGERSSSQAPVGSATEKVSKTNCFYAVGRLNKNEAELFTASGAGDVGRVKQAINAGGNVHAMDALKRTPLFAAAFCNNPEAANLLIDKSSDANAKDFIGMSPLHVAVVMGWAEMAKTLISRGANIDIRSIADRTPLHLAAATNQVAMVELLMERGANAQVSDKDGNTAASLASNNGHPTVVAAIKKWQDKQEASIQK